MFVCAVNYHKKLEFDKKTAIYIYTLQFGQLSKRIVKQQRLRCADLVIASMGQAPKRWPLHVQKCNLVQDLH